MYGLQCAETKATAARRIVKGLMLMEKEILSERVTLGQPLLII